MTIGQIIQFTYKKLQLNLHKNEFKKKKLHVKVHSNIQKKNFDLMLKVYFRQDSIFNLLERYFSLKFKKLESHLNYKKIFQVSI